MRNLDIKLENYPLIYRSKLTIPNRTKFGLELELDQVDFDEVKYLVRKEFGSTWQVKTDKSLTKDHNAEIATPPLYNTKETWIQLKRMGELLQRLNPSYNNCSFQVNFDGSLLPTLKDRVRFLKLYAMYEDIIYRFSKGEDEEYRDSLDMYAHPIILTLKGIINYSPETIVDMFSNNKRYGIVFKSNEKDLIEFRSPNMTDNQVLWQNYVTTFYHLLVCATSNRYDQAKIDTYIDKFYKSYLLESYAIERKDKAMEFSDLIFKNSNDQISFMHQYLKR